MECPVSAVFSTERAPRFTSPGEPVAPRRSYFSDLIQTLFLSDPRSSARGILFTSTTAGAGVSFICSSIATELANQGDRVLLADAQTILRLARCPVESIFPICQRIETSTLWVLGPKQYEDRAPDPHVDVISASAVLSMLSQTFNHIVIDAPSLSTADDAILLATAVHGTVLVVPSGSSEPQEIARICREFSSLGARIFGSVYNARPTDGSQEFAQ
jgi:succinoglycan biosynthesis transport protein ExoP